MIVIAHSLYVTMCCIRNMNGVALSVYLLCVSFMLLGNAGLCHRVLASVQFRLPPSIFKNCCYFWAFLSSGNVIHILLFYDCIVQPWVHLISFNECLSLFRNYILYWRLKCFNCAVIPLLFFVFHFIQLWKLAVYLYNVR